MSESVMKKHSTLFPLHIHRMYRKPLILLFSLIILLPLLQQDLHGGEKYTFDWHWMFYEHETRPGFESYTLRPFFLDNHKGERIFQASLMPVFYWRYASPKKDDRRFLFNLMNISTYRHGNGDIDGDFGLFPFLFFGWGNRAADRYFFLWPVGGTIKQKFAQDTITAFLFPGLLLYVFFPPASIFSLTSLAYMVASFVPVITRYTFKDFTGWELLWPLFHYGKGDKRDEVRLLPLFAVNKKKDRYKKISVLMLFNYQEHFLRDDVLKIFFFLPLFGRKWSRSGKMSSVTLLWPLFSWGRNEKTGEKHYNLPWPLVQIRDSERPKVKKRIFFPLYGTYRHGKNETEFLTPLYFSLKKRGHRFDTEYTIYFIVFWHFKRDYHRGPDPVYGKKWRYFKVWPLFHVEFNDRGDREFVMLSLLPLRDRDGYERLYQPFWSVLEYRRLHTGEKRLGLFMRTYFQVWGNGLVKVKMPFIFSVETRGGKLRHFSLAASLFSYENREDGRYLSLFWFPIPLGSEKKRDRKYGKRVDKKRWPVFNLPAGRDSLARGYYPVIGRTMNQDSGILKSGTAGITRNLF